MTVLNPMRTNCEYAALNEVNAVAHMVATEHTLHHSFSTSITIWSLLTRVLAVCSKTLSSSYTIWHERHNSNIDPAGSSLVQIHHAFTSRIIRY